MNLGKFKITPIVEGMFKLDGGAMFGVVPKPLWNKVNPGDERNRINLSLTSTLIQTENHNILIDTGIGDKWDAKNTDIYAIYHGKGLVGELKTVGIKAEDIDSVILTHLHFDHTGGSTIINQAGEVVPTFPNAKYYVQKGEFEIGRSPNVRIRASYLPDNFMPLYEQGVLELLDGDVTNLLPGISVHISGGHTQYHQIVYFESEGQKGVYWGDLIPTTGHLRYPFIMGYDLYPLETLAQKEILLPKSVEEHWLNCFEHDPIYPMGYLKNGSKHIEFEPLAKNPYAPE